MSALCTLMTLLTWAVEPIDLRAVTTPLECRYSGAVYKNRLFKYRLYIPAQASVTNRLPLIVWLHGLSNAGHDNYSQMAGLDPHIFNGSHAPERYPFFVLAVQCPADNPAWTIRDKRKADDMVDVVGTILRQVLKDYPIDADRVSLTGLSAGGNGCWDLAQRYPEFFAAVAPQASIGPQSTDLSRLKELTIWAFHSVDDAGAKIDSVRFTVAALKAMGCNIHLTEIDAEHSRNVAFAGHDCWTSAFSDYQLRDWMLSQYRGKRALLNGPGSVPISTHTRYHLRHWKWWQLALQVAVPLGFVIAILGIIRQRQGMRR